MTGVLEGQHAIVIGGGSGIGFGTARLLARDGARVTIAGRTEEKLRAGRATLIDEGLDVPSPFATRATRTTSDLRSKRRRTTDVSTSQWWCPAEARSAPCCSTATKRHERTR